MEPNDTPQRDATPTELGRVIRRVLPKLSMPAGDEDWFHLTAAATGDLTISAEQSQPGDNLRLELYDEGATTLLAAGTNLADGAGSIVGERIVFAAGAGRGFLVRVLPNGTGEVRYSLDLQSLTADLGTRVHGLQRGTLTPGDEAFYLVKAGAAGSLDVTATSGANVQGNLNLELLDPNQLTILASGQAAGPPGPGEVERASLPVEKGRAVLIRVSGGAGSGGDFTLEFTDFDQFTTAENATLLFPAGAGPAEVALGDLNGDQKPDLVVSNAFTDTVSVLLGGGDGTFQAPRQFAVGAFVTAKGDIERFLPTFGRAVAIADLNRDLIPDIVVTNYASADVSVLLGRGDGTFEPERRFDATAGPRALDVGDLNNDDVPDLVVTDLTDTPFVTHVAILLGRGDGTFEPQRTFQVPVAAAFS